MTNLFTTIAYQLAKVNSSLRPYILAAIQQNPDISLLFLQEQFQKLIFEPCCSISRELQFTAIVIDGLDESIDEMMQVQVLKFLARMDCNTLCSVTEFEILQCSYSPRTGTVREAFDTKELIFSTQIISLDHIPGISQDIHTVLQSGFSRVLNNPWFKIAFQSVHQPWPSAESIEKLVEQSSGQFIYAATVMKFISDPNHSPAAQLEIVLGIRDSGSSEPLAELDLLYQEI
ncbi:hypothetical protein BDQ17DRAFT_1477448, partial [Cyathus striatus]